MNSNASIIVSADPEALWSMLLDHDSRRRWQTSLRHIERVSGTVGERGSVARLRFDGNRPDELEVVTEVRRPSLLAYVVESDLYRRTVVHSLEDAGNETTRWQAWSKTEASAWTRLRSLFHAAALDDGLDEDMQRLKLMLQSDEADQPS